LNNLYVKNVFDEDYSEYFAMTKEEVDAAIDKLFDIQPALKNKIRSNIDLWYNGYYFDNSSPLYSICSTNLYISDCYKIYKEKGISREDRSDEWIPKPSRKWVIPKTTSVFSNYMNFGFEPYSNPFVLNLYRGIPAYYLEVKKDYDPLLENPESYMLKAEIILHLLMHGGYLTRNEKKKYFKIPNYETRSILEDQLLKYLKEIPIEEEVISDLTSALKDEDFEKVGDVVMKDLFNFSTSYKFKKFRNDGLNYEQYIHLLLGKVFDPLNSEISFIAGPKDEAGDSFDKSLKLTDKNNAEDNLNTIGEYSKDFHFVTSDAKDKIHLLIELETRGYKQKDMLRKALKGLKQIFTNDRHRDILLATDTKAIVNIGMAASTTDVCLSTLKAHIDKGGYVKFEKLKYQHFEIAKAGKNDPEISHSEQKEHTIGFFADSFGPDLKAIEGCNIQERNEQIKETIITEIDKLIKEQVE
jgi:hypothetical protein